MHKVRILCFGDSNTWGFIPGSVDYDTGFIGRYSDEIRWTGLLQRKLGSNYTVIEEGLNGRTTSIDYPDIPHRRGTDYLEPCLYTHAPLDVVILQLGLNDLKTFFNRSPDDVAMGVSELVKIVCQSHYGVDMMSPPAVLLVSPPLLRNESFRDANGNYIFSGAMVKSVGLAKRYAEVAKSHQCAFVDLASEGVVLSSTDGLHLDRKGHLRCAAVMFNAVMSLRAW